MRKSRKRKQNPTPAQLRARAKFVKMVRARAAAKKRANPRGRGLRGATPKQERQYEAIKKSVRRSGKTLKEAKRIAAATTRSRAKNKTIIKAKRVKIAVANKTQRRRNSLEREDKLRLAGLNKLIRSLRSRINQTKDPATKAFLRQQMIELRGDKFALGQKVRASRRNPGRVTPTSRKHREKFTGKPSRKTLSLKAPTGTPKSLAILGRLKAVKGRGFVMPFAKRGQNPNGEIYLAQDDRGDLHIIGNELPVSSEVLTDFGPIQEIEYITQKPHLGYPETTEFFHHMGEEGGRKPHLVTDAEGAYKIEGGDYFITERGIENPTRRRYRRYR